MGAWGPEIRSIPLGEIVAYCDLLRIEDPDHRDAIRAAVQAIDAEFLSLIGKKKDA
jgi:hypothetical protein